MKESALDNFIPSLRTPELCPFANYFGRNLQRAKYLPWKYADFIFADVLEKRHMRMITEVIRDRLVRPVFSGTGKFSEEFMSAVHKRMIEAAGREPEVALASAVEDRIEEIKAKDPEFRDWLRALGQSGAATMWSAFETLASDVWVFAVNSRPDLFAVRVLRGFNEVLPEGMSSRCIPIGLAAKHNFDLRHCIGDIVRKRIDFTSLSEIQKAYKTAFELDEKGIGLLRAPDLIKLSWVRNLIVHRSGIIDMEFKEKTGCSEEVGDEFAVSEDLAETFRKAVLEAGLHLLRTTDDCLTPMSAQSHNGVTI